MFKVGDKVKTNCEYYLKFDERICGKIIELNTYDDNMCATICVDGCTYKIASYWLELDTDCRFKIGDHVNTTKEWHREPFSGTVVRCLFPYVVVKNKCGTEVHHYRDLELDITKLNNTMSSTDICVNIHEYKKQLQDKDIKILELCEEKRQANNDFKYILEDTYNRIKYLERENRDLQDKINNYEHSVKIGLDTCLLAFTLGLGIGMFIIYVIMNL